MRKKYLTILLTMLMSIVGAKAENREDILNAPKGASGVIEINEENFPDMNFRYWLFRQVYGWDGKLTEYEINGITSIDVYSKNISSLKGIEYFTALKVLDCAHNWLTNLDVSNNTALTELYCYTNQLTSLDVSNNTALTYLNCGSNELTSLDVSNNTALETLWCYDNQLTSLNASGCTALKEFWCNENQLTSLDVSKNTALKDLDCGSNQLTSLDVSKNTALTELGCSYNQLTSLDVSNNTALTGLYCSFNQLTSLDVSNNTALKDLRCYRNQIKGEAMDALISGLPQNETDNTYWLRIYYSGNDGNVCTKAQAAAARAKGWTPYYTPDGWYWLEYEGYDEESVIEINEENFPDANFRNWLLQQDYGRDGILTESKINGITYINVGSSNISSLKGIEYFTALKYLRCHDNQLTSLDVSKNTALKYLYCFSNQIKGEAMDALISGLPQNETDETYPIYVYNSEYDGNVCTKAQVAATKAKGWTPYYITNNGWAWYEYKGSDEEPDGINAVSTDKQGNTAIYTLDGKRMNTTNTADLPKGIYIINGKKVIVK